ncbi:hypothetical protein ABZ883_03330 [Streptomyces sp. NPDC046977]|uniref:hypothetical protein n=1 Tax=Streptomyces sp. NPDC046977 TaxID=3154703 RepID=UPI003409901B
MTLFAYPVAVFPATVLAGLISILVFRIPRGRWNIAAEFCVVGLAVGYFVPNIGAKLFPEYVKPVLYGAYAGFAVMLITAVSMATEKSIGVRLHSRHARPLDRAAVRIIGLAATIHQQRVQWSDSVISGRWCREVFEAAGICRLAIANGSRLIGAGIPVLADFATEARRVGLAVEEHASLIARCSRPGDIDAVVGSLSVAGMLLLDGRRDEVISRSPQDPGLSSRFKEYALRTAPAVILIAAGALLPVLPIVQSQGAAADSLRVILLVSGVLSLTSSGKAVNGQVSEALAKVMPWKEK